MSILIPFEEASVADNLLRVVSDATGMGILQDGVSLSLSLSLCIHIFSVHNIDIHAFSMLMFLLKYRSFVSAHKMQGIR